MLVTGSVPKPPARPPDEVPWPVPPPPPPPRPPPAPPTGRAAKLYDLGIILLIAIVASLTAAAIVGQVQH